MAKMFYTLEEAKVVLGESEAQIKQHARDGKLREFRDGPRLMFKADQVEQLKEVKEPEKIDLTEDLGLSSGLLALGSDDTHLSNLGDSSLLGIPALDDSGVGLESLLSRVSSTCSRCKTDIKANVQFCPKCGVNVRADDIEENIREMLLRQRYNDLKFGNMFPYAKVDKYNNDSRPIHCAFFGLARSETDFGLAVSELQQKIRTGFEGDKHVSHERRTDGYYKRAVIYVVKSFKDDGRDLADLAAQREKKRQSMPWAVFGGICVTLFVILVIVGLIATIGYGFNPLR